MGGRDEVEVQRAVRVGAAREVECVGGPVNGVGFGVDAFGGDEERDCWGVGCVLGGFRFGGLGERGRGVGVRRVRRERMG